MSQFSRVKKNKDLYHDIIKEDDTEILETSLRDYERRVNKVEEEETYVASRLKKNEDILTKDLEKSEDIVVNDIKGLDDTKELLEINNSEKVVKKEEILKDRDLLADFIEEVKHYNINRGLRSVQDTQMNILHNLNNDEIQEKPSEMIHEERPLVYEELKRERNVAETVELETVSELTQEIQAIIQDLGDDLSIIEDEESTDEPTFLFKGLDEEQDQELASMFNEIETSALNLSSLKKTDDNHIEIVDVETVENTEPETVEVELVNPKEVLLEEETEKISITDTVSNTPDFKSNELLELTQTLNLKLDLHDQEELDNTDESKSKGSLVDKLLTGVIIILVIALIAIIIVGLWFVYKERAF